MAFDLNKVIAEQPKRRGKKRFAFDFDGNTYTLPNDIDAIALQSAATGFVTDALERLLGPVQWATLKQSPTVPLEQDAIIELLRVYYAHVGGGTTAGESAASSGSSKSTARPSKRTSKRTTASRSRSSAGR